jgi:hypothetical protein
MLAGASVDTVELVLARYNEPVGWAGELGVPVTVVNKGERLPRLDPTVYRTVPAVNHGREADSYLWHLVSRYRELADWTVFAQADPLPHLRGIDLRHLLRPDPSGGRGGFRVPWRVRLREWGEDGRLQWRGGWAERYAGGEIRPSPVSLAEYARLQLGVDIDARGALTYHPGALFAVSRERVLTRSLGFYECLLATVQHHPHPEEAHYLERLWPLIFTDGVGW